MRGDFKPLESRISLPERRKIDIVGIERKELCEKIKNKKNLRTFEVKFESGKEKGDCLRRNEELQATAEAILH